MARQRVQGVASLRRVIRAMPDAVRQEFASEFQAIANRLLGRAKAETPTRTGALRAALRAVVTPKTLMLKLGLISRADNSRYFYGYILDAGRKAKTVTIKRGPRAGAVMRSSAIDKNRYNFVFGRRRDFMATERGNLRRALDRALARVIRGSGND